MDARVGIYEGPYEEAGRLIFYPATAPLAMGIEVQGYGLPVVGPASEWYFARRHGATHSGLDINMRKAPRGDVELGEPVFSVCNGLVVFAGMALGSYWGNLVIVLSTIEGRAQYWRYAHLQDVDVNVGQVIPAGMLVGTIGKGKNDRYWAHLHLDAWEGEMGAAEMWRSRRVEWLNPVEVWREAGFDWEWGVA
jgi:murein DD-endopeptidase MepM/ murein hydrolase activator NlpD